MRFLQFFFEVLVLSFLLSITTGWASPPPSPEKVPGAASFEPNSPHPAKVTFTPHRAIYEMALASVKNGSNITGVSGKMLFEWRDVCDAWAIQQHMHLHFPMPKAISPMSAALNSPRNRKMARIMRLTWRVSDGKETERFIGKASLNDNGGKVTYTAPKGVPKTCRPAPFFRQRIPS